MRERLQSACDNNKQKSLTKMYSLSTKKLGVSNEDLHRGDYGESVKVLNKAASDTNFRNSGFLS